MTKQIPAIRSTEITNTKATLLGSLGGGSRPEWTNPNQAAFPRITADPVIPGFGIWGAECGGDLFDVMPDLEGSPIDELSGRSALWDTSRDDDPFTRRAAIGDERRAIVALSRVPVPKDHPYRNSESGRNEYVYVVNVLIGHESYEWFYQRPTAAQMLYSALVGIIDVVNPQASVEYGTVAEVFGYRDEEEAAEAISSVWLQQHPHNPLERYAVLKNVHAAMHASLPESLTIVRWHSPSIMGPAVPDLPPDWKLQTRARFHSIDLHVERCAKPRETMEDADVSLQ